MIRIVDNLVAVVTHEKKVLFSLSVSIAVMVLASRRLNPAGGSDIVRKFRE